MKNTITIFTMFIFTINVTGQAFEKGTIITKHYDTIMNVKIEKVSTARSLKHLTYVDSDGKTQKPAINTIKSYTRGTDKFTRIYYDREMILVKVVTKGNKVNLYEKNQDGIYSFYIEKIYDELIKVPSSSRKFSKVMSSFLDTNGELAKNIKAQKITDIKEIVNLYNKG